MPRGRRADWSEPSGYVEPSYVPGPDDPAHFFMGAQVGWDSARERPADDAEGRCPMCRSTDHLDGPEVREGSPVACAKCLRWGRERKVVEAMARSLANGRPIDGPELALSDPDLSEAEHAALVARAAARPEARYRFEGADPVRQ